MTGYRNNRSRAVRIARLVAKRFSVDVGDVANGVSKSRMVSRARAVAVAVARRKFKWTHHELGDAFLLNQSSARSAYKRAERDMVEVVEAVLVELDGVA